MRNTGDDSTSLQESNDLKCDDIGQFFDKSWDELFGMDRQEVEAFQLKALQQRFEQMLPQVKALRSLAAMKKVNSIESLVDVTPLLFQHTVYKSYPMAILEKGQFDMLTRWLDDMTTLDLSKVDASGCEGIDHWLETLEAETSLRPYHTSGTTGKLSFIPRSSLERDLWNKAYLKQFEGFANEPGVKLGGNGLRLPVIYPSHRHGRYLAQRIVSHLETEVAPTPDQLYTQSNGTLSADLVSLSGRIRIAQSKGELNKMKLSDAMRIALKRYLDEQERRPEEMAQFFSRMADELRGKQVLLISQASYLFQATERAEDMGLDSVFAPDSFLHFGGGSKGVVLPEDWLERVKTFTGINHSHTSYGMTEITGNMPMCPHGHYHIHPLHIPYLLDPQSGDCLPRSGRQTGRFAAYDLLAQTYWGGFVSGDEVTIEWDHTCSCGRKGPYALKDIQRYSEKVTGDDKVTCAATVDNTDSTLQSLLENMV